MKKLILTSLLFCVCSTSFAKDTRTGVGIESTIATGYGLYAVTMRASSAPGAISSFYLYQQIGTYPSRWREIDLEMTPGFTGVGRQVDPNHTHSLATGQCYSAVTADNLPQAKDCTVTDFLTGTAGSNLSFNSFNYRSVDGSPYPHSNDQVFMPSNNGNDIFNKYFTYYIYYTPQGIYWTKDLPATNLTVQPPTTLPQPSFVKKDFNVVTKNSTWNPSNNNAYQAFWYDNVPLTPHNSDGSLSATGALMKISMNLWDGTNTDPNAVQNWGGPTSPAVGSSSSYLYVAYYPLKTPVAKVGNDPTTLSYGAAAIYSDFTTPNGKFLVNQQPTAFNVLWQVSNGSYLWPLGQLDERNLICGSGNLTMTISDNYPTQRNTYDPVKSCSWLNQN